MQRQALISLFRTIVLAGIAASSIVLTAPPLPAQNSVPATAAQAAKMPQYAGRLARPSSQSAARPNPAVARQGPGQGSGTIYENGPIDGTTDAWNINSGFAVSDSLTVSNCSEPPCITGLTFGAWLLPGDVLQAVEISVTSQPFGGTTYFDGIVNLTQSACTINQYGYNVCTEAASFNISSLNGTYWVNLSNAVVNNGDPVYWDENSGVGCRSEGCPSQADESSLGTIPSESFSILGSTCQSPADLKPVTGANMATVPPSPTQTYRVIYNFTGGADGGTPTAGLVIDAAGNLYGTTGSGGGPAGGGTVFKLTPRSSNWIFSRLYSFTGPNGYYPDATLAVGADGRLYGTTESGGMGQGNGAGVIFGLSPAGNILPTPFSNWTESLLYKFTGGSDGANPGGSLALDASGNIYGTAVTGGANDGGTLYEFTNRGIQVLHSFPAFQGDGVGPIGVVKGANGLYGITQSGSDLNAIGTVYTTAGGYHVLLEFIGGIGQLDSLAVDQADNLYYTFSGIDYVCKEEIGYVEVDELSSSGGGSTLTGFGMPSSELMSWISTDASGNVYGTVDNLGNYGNVYKLTCCWNYTDLHDFAGGPDDGATPGAAPVVDAQGNIYGTTSAGGAYGFGVVWEISP